MKKVHNVTIGSKDELAVVNKNYAVVHACKTSHQQRLNYRGSIKGSPFYIVFRDGDHLYLNWVDEPTGRYYQVETFIEALNFIDEYVDIKDVFIHCDQGQSRSPTLAMLYLAKRTNFLDNNFYAALSKFKDQYPEYAPSGIIKFVEQHWEEIK